MIEFENIVNNSMKGYFISSSELIELSEKIIYLIDIDIIGDSKLSKLDNIKQEIYDFKISLIDSSYWEIYSSNPIFLEKWFSFAKPFPEPAGNIPRILSVLMSF